MTTNMGSILWAAPEMLVDDRTSCYGSSVDIYSFGILLWEMYTRCVVRTCRGGGISSCCNITQQMPCLHGFDLLPLYPRQRSGYRSLWLWLTSACPITP